LQCREQSGYSRRPIKGVEIPAVAAVHAVHAYLTGAYLGEPEGPGQGDRVQHRGTARWPGRRDRGHSSQSQEELARADRSGFLETTRVAY